MESFEDVNDLGEPETTESTIDNDNETSSDIQDDLDMSWLDEQERIQNIQTSYFREPMGSIHVKYIYINQNQYINNIIHEKHALEMFTPLNIINRTPYVPYGSPDSNVHRGMDASGSVLKNDILLRLIQSKKTVTPVSKYKLVDILLYHVDLEPEHIQSYSKSENFIEQSSGFFKVLPIIGNIQISPSIFIFHSTNTLYFIFQEVEIEKAKNKVVLKSILKTRKNQDIESDTEAGPGSGSLKHKSNNTNTKKVRIALRPVGNVRKTRKHYD